MADASAVPVLKVREITVGHATDRHEGPVRRAVDWALLKAGMEAPIADPRAASTLKKRWEIPQHGHFINLAVSGELHPHRFLFGMADA